MRAISTGARRAFRALSRRVGLDPTSCFLLVVLVAVLVVRLGVQASGLLGLPPSPSSWSLRLASRAMMDWPGALEQVARSRLLQWGGPRLFEWLWPLQPAAHHVAVVGVHGINALLLFALGRKLALSAPAAGLGAALFLASDMIATKCTGMEFFCEYSLLTGYLSVCLLYLVRKRSRVVRRRAAWLALEIGAAAIGLLSKESFPVYLGLLFGLELLDRHRTAPGKTLQRSLHAFLRLLPHLALVALLASGILASVSDFASEDKRRLAIEIPNIAQGYWHILAGHVPNSQDWRQPVLAIMLIVSLVLGATIRHRAATASRFALLAVTCVSLPVALFADWWVKAYVYQPSAFFALAIAAVLEGGWSSRRRGARALSVLIAVSALVVFLPSGFRSSGGGPDENGDTIASLRWEVEVRREEICPPKMAYFQLPPVWRMSAERCRALDIANPVSEFSYPSVVLQLVCDSARGTVLCDEEENGR